MNRTTQIFLLVIVAIFFLYEAMDIKPPSNEIMSEDMTLISTGTKPIVYYLNMKGCSACKYFEPLFEEKSKLYNDKFEFKKEDVYKSPIARRLKVNSLPAVFIIEPQKRTAQQIKTNCIFSPHCFDETLKAYTKPVEGS